MHPVLINLLAGFFMFSCVCFFTAGVCRWWMHRIDKKILRGALIDRGSSGRRRDDLVLIQQWALGIGGVFVFIALCTVVIAL
jgi:hypothetical protein